MSGFPTEGREAERRRYVRKERKIVQRAKSPLFIQELLAFAETLRCPNMNVQLKEKH